MMPEQVSLQKDIHLNGKRESDQKRTVTLVLLTQLVARRLKNLDGLKLH
jgi:hypothetical protein